MQGVFSIALRTEFYRKYGVVQVLYRDFKSLSGIKSIRISINFRDFKSRFLSFGTTPAMTPPPAKQNSGIRGLTLNGTKTYAKDFTMAHHFLFYIRP